MSTAREMTRDRWLAAASPDELLGFVRHHAGFEAVRRRKIHLLCVAYCRSVWHLITDENCRRGIEAGERRADGAGRDRNLGDAGTAIRQLMRAAEEQLRAMGQRSTRFVDLTCMLSMARAAHFTIAGEEIDTVRSTVLNLSCWEAERTSFRFEDHHREVSRLQAELMRDSFGDPFRTVVIDPRWLTSTVVDLSNAIYQERAFDRMPILADALMDAGCADEELIAHCRGDGPHARGCWVVDLVLGKG